MKILVLNSGSSTQKACLYDIGEALPIHPQACLWEGRIEWDRDTAAVAVKARGIAVRQRVAAKARDEVLNTLLSTIWTGNTAVIGSASGIDAVGHRVVHGGRHFEDPVAITPEVVSAIAAVSAFAPLHIRSELEGIRMIEGLLGAIPQMAVFDTGFHRQMPPAAAVYPGPYEWFEIGIRRYGFHGINHQYCAGRAAQLLDRDVRSLKLVTCHLGNGCSIAAIDGGRSVDTTMGFTPLDGLMMGTRSGAVDPGILTYLMREHQLGGPEIDKILNQWSGLLGVSGVSGDMREILSAIKDGHQRAKLAFDIYVHRIRSAIGGMIAVLGGMDALVFTGGVGENSPDVRAAACGTFAYLGLSLDEGKNAHPSLDEDISNLESQVRVLVIHAEEDWAIAAECWKLARAGAPAVKVTA
jgi:acetate kinase